MARQLDFRPLDFRASILNDRTGSYISGAIQDIGKAATGAIRERRARKEQIKKDFIDQMTYDTSITGNNIINNRVSYEYGKLKDKYLKVMQDRKGWLTPEDMINLRSDMEGLSSLANQLKSVQNMFNNAKKIAISKDGRDMFDLDTSKWGELMSIVSGETDTANLIGELNNIQQSDTEFPFLNYQAHDILSFENSLIKPYRQTFAGDTEQVQSTKEKEGKQYTSTTKITSFGTPEDAMDFYKGNLLKLGQRGIGYIKGIQNNLTQQEKEEAIKQYGTKSENQSQTPYLDYYLKNKFNPEKLTRLKEEKKITAKPLSKGAGGLSLFFGGGAKPGPDQYVPKRDVVEGVDMNEYVEFAKAGIRPKSVQQVTVTGAQRINDGNISEPMNLDSPSDYKIAGYSLDRNKIILTEKASVPGYSYQKTYMVPYKGNEHFLDKLFDEETLKEIQRRSSEGARTKGLNERKKIKW